MKGWLVAFGSLLVVLAAIEALRSCQSVQTFEPVTYLVPEGYTGPIHVVYGIKSGTEPEYKDGRRIYRIPEDGVLLTQMPLNEGLVSEGSRRFFYVTDKGKKIPIEEARTWEEIKKSPGDEVYALEGSIGSTSGAPGLGCEVSSQRYGIGTKADHKEMKMGLKVAQYLKAEGVECSDIRDGDGS